MKIIIIGLGNFGMSAAINLSNTNNEVIAVDINPERIELVKDQVAHAVAFDAKKEAAYNSLPLKNTDLVVVALGDKNGAAIISVAIIKKMTDAKIIARSSSPIEDTILEAMGVDEIIHPENEYAEKFTKTVNLGGSIDNFELDDDHLVSEIEVPKNYIGKAIKEVNFRQEYDINIITILRYHKKKNILGNSYKTKQVLGTPGPDTILEKEDVLVVFGKDKNIKRLIG